jgi:hypothetical protein
VRGSLAILVAQVGHHSIQCVTNAPRQAVPGTGWGAPRVRMAGKLLFTGEPRRSLMT